MRNAFSFLEDTHLRRLANPELSLATVTNKESLRTAWELMIKRNIYAVPVLNADSHQFLGLLPLSTIVRVVVQLFAARAGGAGNVATHSFSTQEINDITYAFNQMHVLPEHIAPVRGRTPGINILEAINFFVGPGNDSHAVRLPIVDEDGQVVNMVSPSMILKFLMQHVDQLPQHLLNREISHFPGVVSPSVETVRSTERTLDAFLVMTNKGFSALGIEDADGPTHRHVLSVVSHKDAGHAFKDLGKLMLPVEEFVNEIRREDIVDRAPVMNVATNDSLLHVMKKFGAVQRHRMFVRNPHTQEMVGILTVSDVLKAFASVDVQ